MILSPNLLSNATFIARDVIPHGELNFANVTNALLDMPNAQFRMQWLACNRKLDVMPWMKENHESYEPIERFFNEISNSRIGSSLIALANHFYCLEFKDTDDLILPSFDMSILFAD